MKSHVEQLAVIAAAKKINYLNLMKDENATLRKHLERILFSNSSVKRDNFVQHVQHKSNNTYSEQELRILYGISLDKYQEFESEVIKIRNSGIPLIDQIKQEIELQKEQGIKLNPPELQERIKGQFHEPVSVTNHTTLTYSRIEQLFQDIKERRDHKIRSQSVYKAITNKKGHLLKLSVLFKPEFDSALRRLQSVPTKTHSYFQSYEVVNLLQALHVSESKPTIEKWLEAREIKCTKVGKYRRVEREDLIKFIGGKKNNVFKKIVDVITAEDEKIKKIRAYEEELRDIDMQLEAETDKWAKHELFQRQPKIIDSIESNRKSLKTQFDIQELKNILGAQLFI